MTGSAGFDLGLVEWLHQHRLEPVTGVLQLFTQLGEIEGYVLVVAIIHGAFDKRLAVRLAALALLTMSLNHVLKSGIANPRPFVAEGTFAERWAVSPEKADELVAEYSTPSGHAMAGSAFYGHLLASSRSSAVRVLAVVALLGLGASRPYLGVHYVEDVLLGWALGIPIALLAVRLGPRVGAAWSALRLRSRAAILVASSVALWLGSQPVYAAAPNGPPLPFVGYLGLLTGIGIGYPLECRWVGFDPRSRGVTRKALRIAVTVALVMLSLLALDGAFARVAADESALGSLLRYVRYAVAGALGVLGAPLLWKRLGWVETQEGLRAPRRDGVAWSGEEETVTRYVCVIQEGQAAQRSRAALEEGLARIGQECFGDEPGGTRIDWTLVKEGFAWTAGEPSTSSIVARSVPVGLPGAEREAFLQKVGDLWAETTGCSLDEIVVTAWDGPLPL